MKKINVADATTKQLNHLVHVALGFGIREDFKYGRMYLYPETNDVMRWDTSPHDYCGVWNHGGPIIEREELCVGRRAEADPAYCPQHPENVRWWSKTSHGGYLSYGPTPLVAAMRCYCCSKLGDEIDIPEELCQSQNS